MTDSPITRYLPYWCFYLHQGMITALIMQGVAGYFRHAGLDLAQLSWLSLTFLPWIAKCLWAPWGERHALPLRGNPYLGSLALLQIAMAIMLVGIGMISPEQSVLAIVIALMLLALLSASHDIYADGITICTTSAASRALANTAQVGGSYLGILFGSYAFLSIAEQAGWRGGFFALAGLSLLMLILPLRYTRQPQIQHHQIQHHQIQQTIRPTLNRLTFKALWPVLAFTAIFYLAMRGMMALQTVMLIDQKLSLSQLGMIMTVYSTVVSGVGIVLANVLIRRMGALRCLLPVMVTHALLAVALAVGYPLFTLNLWIALFGVVNLAAAIGFVTLYNVLMGLVRPHQPASDYALFQSTDAAVAMIVSIAALQLAHYTNYQTTLGVLACFAIASLWPAKWLSLRLSRVFSDGVTPATVSQRGQD
ncbi:MFS transporter [Pectobacterium aroidearum]|uniref:MFS transporter n=1 Tax=Pectobacterium aroidearum TaxID=1201031 RepID=A0ABR5ZDL4_9GAMM|nr:MULTISPECIES: MFS transporter [Pectobacterium]MBA5199869.1 MFS transporter [Pectobacterium aroidearum]MBA5228139.1 MFS transporter [Pectobacterium aroidearum]MBA5232661.1 MFS transporter [Pectobacterium aroidearum]MBA5737663.1 MFS transporter [Pectobacterium aroidearum]UXK01789.1 MFS transporter [Pectobacterium aroidearum]